MKRQIRRMISLLLFVAALFSLVSCQGAPAGTTATAPESLLPTVTETIPTTQPTTEPEPEPALPEYMNPLTGLACDPSLVGQRPVSIVFNNIKPALPQRSISDCDIVYEVLAEGGILRLLGVKQDYASLGDIGSMRSSRPYLVELAMAYDSVFVHAGGSWMAYDLIRELNVEVVDGVRYGPGWAFWRDQDRLSAGIAYEHTMFTSGERVASAINAKGHRKELNDPNFTAFQFTPYNDPLGTGVSATYVKVPHSNYTTSEFEYNAEDGLYYHKQYGAPHVDELNGKQVVATNLFLLFTTQALYPEQTTTSYRKIDLVGEGEGYYMYGGEAMKIIWKRDSATGSFSYFDEEGNPLSVKCGKSYISIVDVATQSKITIS